jgi:hypothetical protein
VGNHREAGAPSHEYGTKETHVSEVQPALRFDGARQPHLSALSANQRPAAATLQLQKQRGVKRHNGEVIEPILD